MQEHLTASVYDRHRTVVGEITLPSDVFGCSVSDGAIWAVVKAQLASRRQGTHKTKKRGEVSGGGAKPFKQKGTGRARQGSTRAPNQVGGGTCFGPVPRDYSYRPPRAMRRTALKSVLSMRAAEGNVVVVDSLALEKPSTKSVQEFLNAFELQGALFVDVANGAFKLSARNLVGSQYIESAGVNVYDVMRYRSLVLSRQAVELVAAKARGQRNDNSSAEKQE